MSPPATPEPSVARELAAGAVVCAAAATLLMLAVAAAVGLSGQTAAARRALGFDFGGLPRTGSEALTIAAHNGRFAAAVLLAALAAPRFGRALRPLLHAVLIGLLALNAGAIGVALGAYGRRAARALLPHLPLEFAAFSLAGGAYLAALRAPLTLRALATVAATSAALLAAAAAVETFLSPGGPR